MSNYPDAYCIKCKTHTDTVGRHTVIMQNGARALHGVCPKCESEVFQIMSKNIPAQPAKREKPEREISEATKMTSAKNHAGESSSQKSSSGGVAAVYPDAYCVKCKTTTPALKGHTVILANDRRALRGVCPNCSSEIYKILPRKKDFSVNKDLDSNSPAKDERPISLAVTKLSDDREPNRKWRTAADGIAVVVALVILVAGIWYLGR